MKIVFFGSSHFAAPSLRALLAGRHEVSCVVTQPDRKKGRGLRVEATAIKNVFGQHLKKMALSAPKSMFGNLLGAQTSLDLIATILAMQNNLVPPTINFSDCDPRCDIDCTPNKAREKKIEKAIIIARGRGGINMVLGVEKA